MKLARLTLTLTLLVPALARPKPPEPPKNAPPLFESRVPYEPLVKKLADANQSRAKILHPQSGRDLLRLKPGQRYKFIVDGAGKLAIAPLPADAPGNEYVHPILAGGGPVATAGGISVDHKKGAIARITVDEDSKAYCPSFASLDAAEHALVKLGLVAALVSRADKVPDCAVKP
jgi:hypothetical protein